jgi:hypothetical protein
MTQSKEKERNTLLSLLEEPPVQERIKQINIRLLSCICNDRSLISIHGFPSMSILLVVNRNSFLYN